MQQPIRVLLVEDEVMIAMCLEAELTQAGYHICKRVGTGEEAILAAAQHIPDVILMDIRLAGALDGVEAAQKIQASSAVPIIFMTGYLDRAFKERASQLRPLGFLIKPLRIQDINTVIISPS